jgi:acyl-CoA thioester hydrolase
VSFHWDSPVFFDELDLNGTLHNARFAVHVERAQSALFEHLGKRWPAYAERDPDLHYVVRTLHVELLAPFTAPGPLPVELTAEHLGTTSARYGFRCGRYAEGYRVIVKLDRDTGRPAPWSDWYRTAFEELRS